MPMLSLIAALISGAAITAGPTDSQTARLIGIFESTCMSREMKLSVNDARRISYDKLPEGLPQGKELARQPLSADVWLLNTPGRTYVYILKYHEIPGIVSERVCGLASDKIDFEAASDWVLAKTARTEGALRWPSVKEALSAYSRAGDRRFRRVRRGVYELAARRSSS